MDLLLLLTRTTSKSKNVKKNIRDVLRVITKKIIQTLKNYSIGIYLHESL